MLEVLKCPGESSALKFYKTRVFIYAQVKHTKMRVQVAKLPLLCEKTKHSYFENHSRLLPAFSA